MYCQTWKGVAVQWDTAVAPSITALPCAVLHKLGDSEQGAELLLQRGAVLAVQPLGLPVAMRMRHGLAHLSIDSIYGWNGLMSTYDWIG